MARRKVTARGLDGRVVLDAGDAEHLHVADASVDVATVAFGVRNFGDLDAGAARNGPHDKAGRQGRCTGVLAAPQPAVQGVVRILYL